MGIKKKPQDAAFKRLETLERKIRAGDAAHSTS
jgi:hypothetical protein